MGQPPRLPGWGLFRHSEIRNSKSEIETMKSLFLRIFLWFWIAMVVVGVVLVVTSPY